jgi:hypothetical protein
VEAWSTAHEPAATAPQAVSSPRSRGAPLLADAALRDSGADPSWDTVGSQGWRPDVDRDGRSRRTSIATMARTPDRHRRTGHDRLPGTSSRRTRDTASTDPCRARPGELVGQSSVTAAFHHLLVRSVVHRLLVRVRRAGHASRSPSRSRRSASPEIFEGPSRMRRNAGHRHLASVRHPSGREIWSLRVHPARGRSAGAAVCLPRRPTWDLCD